MSRILPLFLAALAAPVATFAAEPAPAAEAASEPKAFAAGEPASDALLPSDWIRGEPIRRFEPGHTYVLTTWNTVGGHDFAPGYNLTREMTPVKNIATIHPIVLFMQDDISAEKLAKRLAYPSQMTPYPIARVKDGSPALEQYSRLGRDERRQQNTLVVRDGRIVWTGNGFDISASQLRDFSAPDFNYDRYVEQQAQKGARMKDAMKKISGDCHEALKNKDYAKASAILDEIETRPDLDSFIYSRLRDMRCGIALERNDIPGAIAEMDKLSEKFPDNDAVQSWVHKMITQTEEMNTPGQALAAKAASRVAAAKSGDMARAWWEAAANHYENSGDKKAALKALESAEREAGPYTRLQAMKAGKSPE